MFWWYLGYTIGLWYFGCHACALVLSHRLTEFVPILNKYFIKKLECRSDKANTFIQRVDEEISKAENADGRRAQRRTHHSEERLSHKQFTKLNWEEAIKPYNISHEILNDDYLDDSLKEESDDLENSEEDHIHEMNNNEPGESNHLLDRDIKMEDAGDQNENQHHFNVLNFPNEWT
ncbi:hypothetical protein O181_116998 [Austropuccinia psidii MF-1]|uniref:Uncharacterized protein n=1 Tax=Austropuccinia psidii MF-1 TaxID=1389203 RepID=A0A9Q3K9G8_9BASI|nr:hypothetical protein [Austropuccinia psidii MF-1]